MIIFYSFEYMELELKTALVTGGTGFIGTVLCARLYNQVLRCMF